LVKITAMKTEIKQIIPVQFSCAVMAFISPAITESFKDLAWV